MNAYFLELKNISKSYRNKQILKDVSLSITEGHFLSIVGPSGCGKSTLLKIISQLENSDSGVIERSEKAQKLSYVFQDANLLPWRTVKENILLPLELLNQPTDLDLGPLLQLVKLERSSHLFPHELSGGMKMRTSIARALVTKPNFLLLDEPFSALDEITRTDLEKEISLICRNQKLTVIFITHSISEAVALSDRILIMNSIGQFYSDESIDLSLDERAISSLKRQDYVTKISAQLKESYGETRV